MKQNTQNQLNPEQDIELTFIPDFQRTPMVVTGAYEAVMPVAEAVQALEAAPIPQTSKLATTAIKAAQTAPESLTQLYVEPTRRERIAQYFADAHVRKFDKAHNTDLYGELQAKRRKTAVFLKASELHLFDADSDYYKAQLRRMTKR